MSTEQPIRGQTKFRPSSLANPEASKDDINNNPAVVDNYLALPSEKACKERLRSSIVLWSRNYLNFVTKFKKRVMLLKAFAVKGFGLRNKTLVLSGLKK